MWPVACGLALNGKSSDKAMAPHSLSGHCEVFSQARAVGQARVLSSGSIGSGQRCCWRCVWVPWP